MAQVKDILTLFAGLLSYPTSEYKKNAHQLVLALGEQDAALQAFMAFIDRTKQDLIEEQFTAVFDMNKTTCLEIGWHLFGEDYKRGEFLVHMRQALQEYKIRETVELPDHISHCLLLTGLLDQEDAQIYTTRFLSPALKIILSNFNEENPFYPLVEALNRCLNEYFPPLENSVEMSATMHQPG